MAEVREEMRNIQENCEQQVEAVLEEKKAQSASFAKEKKKLESATMEQQTRFVKEREARESEQEKEKAQIRSQYEKERSKMKSDFEKEKKQYEAEKDAAMAAANKDMKSDLKRMKEEVHTQCVHDLVVQKRELEQAHSQEVQQAKIAHAKRVVRLQIAVQQQLDGLKEACRTCMETQKKDYDAKRTAIPDLGFSAASMMDPFAGLSTSPMMDPFAGIDMGDAPVEEPKPAAPAPAPEPVKEDHVEDTAFEGFALGDYSGIEVTDAMVTVEAAPEVDKEKVTRLQSVGEALWCEG